MTTVNFTLTRTDHSGAEVPSDGRLRFVPLGGLSTPGFTVSVGADGFEAVDLAPTPLGAAWKVAVNVARGDAWIDYVLVPDAVSPVSYESLVKADPATLNATGGTPDPLWYAHVDTLTIQATNAAADARGSREAAEAAQDAAVESQDSAAVSASLAEDSADRAGTSAFNAGQSAAVALEHRDDASAASTAAGASALAASTAEGNATAAAATAGTHRTAAETARTAAETARNLSESYATGFSIGDVTTVGPNDPADAAITGAPGTQLLHLTLPSGPATNLTIVETTTGPETPGATGPQGLKGDKGDPGGYTTPTVLTAGTNLDGVLTPGWYLNPSANAAAGPPNAHQTTGGHLEVQQSAGYIIQWYTVITEVRETHVRYRNSNGTWNPWFTYHATRIDQTAGRAIYEWDSVNNRDQLVYGDTGNRDLAASLLNGWTATWFRVRRVGWEVTMTFLGMNSSVATADAFYILPVGFRANTGGYHQGFWFTDTTTGTGFLRLTGSGQLELTRRPATAYAANLQAVVKWTTEEAWPVALPGASGGAIPNL